MAMNCFAVHKHVINDRDNIKSIDDFGQQGHKSQK